MDFDTLRQDLRQQRTARHSAVAVRPIAPAGTPTTSQRFTVLPRGPKTGGESATERAGRNGSENPNLNPTKAGRLQARLVHGWRFET